MECRQHQGWTPDLGDHFGDKSEIPENAIIFSISPLGEEIYRMYWMIPCYVTTSLTRNSKNIHEMKVPENELDIYIDSVTEKVQENELNSDSMNKNVEIVSETWYKSVTLNANDKYFEVDFKLDTGAEVNILPLYVLNIVKVKPNLSETNLSLTAYGNFKLKPEGTIIINCSTSKLKNIPLQFYVVNVKSKPILGLKGCFELKLIESIDAIECSKISKNELIKQYKDVFPGTGEFPDEPYHITLKDNAIPVIHPPRREIKRNLR
ncbi:hypothetical protein AVEN_155832-1 [Araneus ventricosus]|uniref:Peptidase A2 domain-containing protein n=1 Tax=Araneus ventricosus TaxID=182803 RepID=A0A4Y2WFW1_ARAVE|nr:hypothetical protein AVEN_194930-1 [Araneus ventricosus]GBO35881.1 hypothetical protein AVEN_155832-1 [Araneus ventricosus]